MKPFHYTHQTLLNHIKVSLCRCVTKLNSFQHDQEKPNLRVCVLFFFLSFLKLHVQNYKSRRFQKSKVGLLDRYT